MLNPAEADAVAARFGVALAQVRRDHLISHLLAALAAIVGDQVVFFGGTALARTLVPDGRLSEDIDLLARASRSSIATTIQRDLTRLLRREYPGLSWEPELTAVRDTEPAVLRAPEGTTVRVQLLNAADYQPWPVTRTDLTQRYADAAPARLLVPTPAAFAAWNLGCPWDVPPIPVSVPMLRLSPGFPRSRRTASDTEPSRSVADRPG